MNIRCIYALALLALLSFTPVVRAQKSAFTATNQSMAVLPGGAVNLSILDGDLYCYASGILLKAQRSGEQIVGFWPDTTFVRFDPDVNYVVRQPSTGDLYFTKIDKKGRSQLYRYRVGRNGKGNVKRMKIGSGIEIEHPTFTTDGHIMIFASLEKRHSMGGYDLWYVEYENDKWGKPINLGDRVNTNSDEISPVIYNDCLIFSSNGQKDGSGYHSLYSTRLVSERRVDDTIKVIQVGRCHVQRLPEEINDPDADDYEMAIDTASGYGYWISTRDDSDTNSIFFSFNGGLDGVQLWGQVLDKLENRLEGVVVTAMQGGEGVCSTITDVDGFYRLYLQGNQYYELSYQLDDFFVDFEQVNTAKTEDEYLIGEARQDVVLEKLVLNQRIYFNDLFGPNADVEISEYGYEQLEPLIRFLLDNPRMNVTLTLVSELTENAVFNGLLTNERIQSLRRHFYRSVPSSVNLTFVNGCNETTTSANGSSRLTVVISK